MINSIAIYLVFTARLVTFYDLPMVLSTIITFYLMVIGIHSINYSVAECIRSWQVLFPEQHYIFCDNLKIVFIEPVFDESFHW